MDIFLFWLMFSIAMAIVTAIGSSEEISSKKHFAMWVALPILFFLRWMSDVRIILYKDPLKRFLKCYLNGLFP